MSVDPGDGRPGQKDGQVVRTSPTVYSEDNMPRTVEASRFIMVVLKAQGLRTRMLKLFENMEGYIEEIKELDPEESNKAEESEYFLKRWADVDEQFKKVEKLKAEHEDLVSKVRLMCGFILKEG